MADVAVKMTLEVDLVQDAMFDLQRIFLVLAKRHGPQYRELEKRIERSMDSDELPPLGLHHIGEGRHVASPPAEFSAIIRDAKALGVI